jgi:hypothetical protein
MNNEDDCQIWVSQKAPGFDATGHEARLAALEERVDAHIHNYDRHPLTKWVKELFSLNRIRAFNTDETVSAIVDLTERLELLERWALTGQEIDDLSEPDLPTGAAGTDSCDEHLEATIKRLEGENASLAYQVTLSNETNHEYASQLTEARKLLRRWRHWYLTDDHEKEEGYVIAGDTKDFLDGA